MSRVFGALSSMLVALPSNRSPDVQEDPTSMQLGAPRLGSYWATTWDSVMDGDLEGLAEGPFVGL